MEHIKILAIVFVGTFLIFGIGFICGVIVGFNQSDEENQHADLYCFQCEFGMPTTYKKGALCCSNCGLKHSNNIANKNPTFSTECPHVELYTKVLSVQGICETMVVACSHCDKHLSIPKVEC